MECAEACDNIKAGDEVTVDFNTGVIRNVTTDKEFRAAPFPEFVQEIIKAGGLLKSIKK